MYFMSVKYICCAYSFYIIYYFLNIPVSLFLSYAHAEFFSLSYKLVFYVEGFWIVLSFSIALLAAPV